MEMEQEDENSVNNALQLAIANNPEHENEPYFGCNQCQTLIARHVDLTCNFGMGDVNAWGWFRAAYQTMPREENDHRVMEVYCRGCETFLGYMFHLPENAVNHLPIMQQMGPYVLQMAALHFIGLLENPVHRPVSPAFIVAPLGGNPIWQLEEFKNNINYFINVHNSCLAMKRWLLN